MHGTAFARPSVYSSTMSTASRLCGFPMLNAPATYNALAADGERSSGNGSGWLVRSHHGVADTGRVKGILNSSTRRTPSPCPVDNMYINNNKPLNMDVDSSRTIVEDYVRYRLESNGLSWQNGQRDVTPNEIQQAMRALGDEFESRFSQAFDDMINQLHITTETAYQTFRTIVNEIFSDGVNWGRIVALFGFGGKLAVRCVQQAMPQLVNSIVDWVSTYVDTTLYAWISSNEGWAGFLEFYEGDPEKRAKDWWPSLKTIFSYAAAGLGIFTLGAFLSQKS